MFQKDTSDLSLYDNIARSQANQKNKPTKTTTEQQQQRTFQKFPDPKLFIG